MSEHEARALAEWAELRRREREAEAAGAPHGRCREQNGDEWPFAGEPVLCGAALLPAEQNPESTFCVSCLWRDVRDYGEDG